MLLMKSSRPSGECGACWGGASGAGPRGGPVLSSQQPPSRALPHSAMLIRVSIVSIEEAWEAGLWGQGVKSSECDPGQVLVLRELASCGRGWKS